MHELLDKVKRELDKIGDKGLTSSNLETTYKLIDIYKDIKEAEYYEDMCKESSYGAQRRDSRGRYMGDSTKLHYYPWDDSVERYFEKMRDSVDNYSEGKDRYKHGDEKEREQMIEGIDMAMSALVSFVESLYDHTETQKEKDVIREHIDKLKRI